MTDHRNKIEKAMATILSKSKREHAKKRFFYVANGFLYACDGHVCVSTSTELKDGWYDKMLRPVGQLNQDYYPVHSLDGMMMKGERIMLNASDDEMTLLSGKYFNSVYIKLANRLGVERYAIDNSDRVTILSAVTDKVKFFVAALNK